MKKYVFFVVTVMIISVIIASCSSDDEEPAPFMRKKDAWACGFMDSTGYGMIIHSSDSGETWVRQGQGSDALKDIDVSDIWAVDENTVWAVGSQNSILRTWDGGQTWTRIQPPVNKPGTLLSAISIINKTNIWISGDHGTVYNSTDNGTTWQAFDSSLFQVGLMQGIWAVTSQKVFVVGGVTPRDERGLIVCTNDGGITWDSVSLANKYYREGWIGVTSYGNTIVIYGGKSHYAVSFDGGATWKNDSLYTGGGGGGADINHLIMLNPMTWWGAFDMGHIYLTLDGGSAWTEQQTGMGGEFLVGIDAWDSDLALAVGTLASWPPYGPILKTSDGGKNWILKSHYRSNLSKVTFIKP